MEAPDDSEVPMATSLTDTPPATAAPPGDDAAAAGVKTKPNVRDDFSEKVKRVLALRAGYLCSFAGCARLTVGPSQESPDAHTTVGVAAHISAAAPGGRRYRAELTHEERRSIENGIWLCQDHGALIDRDETTYTESALREMRRNHEATVAQHVAARKGLPESGDFIALGPNIVFIGRVASRSAHEATVRILLFVRGNRSELAAFCSQFAEYTEQDRHILFNEFGDGWILAEPPNWRSENGLELQCRMEPRFPRIRAQDLGADLKLDEATGDLDIAMEMISGVAVLPQKLSLCLSARKGNWFLDTEFGTRIAEYVELFDDSPFLDRLAMLEVVRIASIPVLDSLAKRRHTPLECIERITNFRFLARPQLDATVEIELDCVVKGLGAWKRTLKIHLYRERGVEPIDIQALVQSAAAPSKRNTAP